MLQIFIVTTKSLVVTLPFVKGFNYKYIMRPLCSACNQRPSAVNYRKDDVVHYRTRCDICIKKNRKQKPPVPAWQTAGYKKKPTCDRCGFKARYASQLLVFHIDGRMKNCDLKNLRTVCLNCVEEVKRMDMPWAKNDLQVDR